MIKDAQDWTSLLDYSDDVSVIKTTSILVL